MIKKNPKEIQIFGSILGEYSLARVNRSFAAALAKVASAYHVSLATNLAQTSKLPTANDLKTYPVLAELYSEKETTDILIYNNFPKSLELPYGFKDFKAQLKLAYLAWEESIFPEKYVAECNQYLHGLLVSSSYVKEVMEKSGISIPICNISEGIDFNLYGQPAAYPLKTNKKFKFLHVSSAHYRKGIDVLIKAYCQAFTKSDDVVLVIKHFPNSDSELQEVLQKFQNEHSPEILVIDEANLSDNQMFAIFQQCDAVVQPTRAEGFGMPMAEAFYAGKPLITTGFSGQLDFCNAENCFLLDYHLVSSKSHLLTPGAQVAEPDFDDLVRQMRFISAPENFAVVAEKVENARKSIEAQTWENTAKKALDFIKTIEPLAPLKNKVLAVLSPLNSAGGISEYTRDLFGKIASSFAETFFLADQDLSTRTQNDAANVKRCWTTGENSWQKLQELLTIHHPDIIHIQYHPSFFSFNALAQLIEILMTHNIIIELTLHNVCAPHLDWQKHLAVLKKVVKIFTLSEADQNLLQKIGLANISLVNHGTSQTSCLMKAKLKHELALDQFAYIIATHGLIHDKKGLLEMLEAAHLLQSRGENFAYLAINAVNPDNSTSQKVHELMLQKISDWKLEKNVFLIDSYLPVQEVNNLLSLADLIIYPYAQLTEGASGAITKAVAVNVPAIYTDVYLFHNLSYGFKIPDNQPAHIVTAIHTLLTNQEMYQKQKQLMQIYLRQNSWEQLGIRLLRGMVEELEEKNS
ncbi:MAG: glycosyltransferase [bacterium]